jgi:tetratricopeptide (TPR) repeat protein
VPIRAEPAIEVSPPASAIRRVALLCAAIAWACLGRPVAPAAAEPPVSANAPASAAKTAASASDVRVDSSDVIELLRLAERERRAGDVEAEYGYLAQVIERDSAHSRAHARLAEITGRAPKTPASNPDDLVTRALRHPYDPTALVAAAAVLAERGESDRAIGFLERAVWLADLDPSAGLTAIRQLYVLSDDWKRHRIVPVQLHVDELIRTQPDWEFQMRNLWLSASAMLDSALETRFVPIAIQPFDVGETPNDLDRIYRAFLDQTRPPAEGIFAAITGLPLPSGDAVYRKGVSKLLGRSLVVRVAPGAVQSRVLAHELLHLYGAIHVLDDVESLMNPTGESLALDAPNIRIVRSLRARRFGPGGIEENVIPEIDLGVTVAAYRAALSENLNLREAEIEDAMRSNKASSDEVAYRIHKATYLDSHLADAAQIVAGLMLSDGQRVEALRLLDLATQLYGRLTPRGRDSAEKAQALRESLGPANAPTIE